MKRVIDTLIINLVESLLRQQNGLIPTPNGMMLKVILCLNMAEKSLSLVEMVKYSSVIDQTQKKSL